MDISVNVAKKQIDTDPIKSLLVQGESQVDNIIFKLPLTYGDVALSGLTYTLSMTNEKAEVTITTVLTKSASAEGVDVIWNITASFTAIAGEFKLAIACSDESGNTILKLLGDSIFVRKDPNAQGFGSIPIELYEQLLAQINYQIAHMQVVRILDTYATLSALTAAITEPSVGDMYNVGSAAPYTVYVWQGEWVSLGALQGIQGIPGNDGQDGTDGTDGVGVPVGGALNTYLRKKSAADHDTEFGVISASHIGSYGVPPLDANGRIPATSDSVEINDQTENYTVLSTDFGKEIRMTNAAARTVTFPTGLPASFYCFVSRGGAGDVTLAAGSGATLNAPGGRLKIFEQYCVVTVQYMSANSYRANGKLVS